MHAAPLDELDIESLVTQALAEAGGPQELMIAAAGNIPWTEDIPRERRLPLIQDFQEHAQWIIGMLLSKGIVPENIVNKLGANDPKILSYGMVVDTYEMKIEVLPEQE